ncbi:MAG: DUF308 domain-containing protein [Bacteroidaceae bacterium]|nr:DUF308 domain-containing protein [Bacteroidaceae bacterium]
MKSTRSTIILALSTILIGALIIAFPTHATRWLIMAIGALFLVPGAVSIATYIYQQRKKPETAMSPKGKDEKGKASKAKTLFPFIGIGSVLFGAVLLIIPNSFLNALLYILGTFLILAALQQIYRFLQLRKQYKLGATPYIVSSLIAIAGIVIIVLNYQAGAAPATAGTADTNNPTYLPSIIFGIAGIIYGLTEIIYAIQFRKSDKMDTPKTDDNIIEEEIAQEPEPEPAPSPATESKTNTIEAEVDAEA